MADLIPDLWGESISFNDFSPVMILHAQALALERRTKGLIIAELIQRKSRGVTEIMFDIVSPTAKHRSRILSCKNFEEEVYPVWIKASALYQELDAPLVTQFNPLALDEEEFRLTRVAFNQVGAMNLIAKVIQSPYVNVKITSMIARNNELAQKLDRLIIEEDISDRTQAEKFD